MHICLAASIAEPDMVKKKKYNRIEIIFALLCLWYDSQ